MSGSENLIESQVTKALLRESEEQYRAVTQAATDSIITIDSDSTLLSINVGRNRVGSKAEPQLARRNELVT